MRLPSDDSLLDDDDDPDMGDVDDGFQQDEDGPGDELSVGRSADSGPDESSFDNGEEPDTEDADDDADPDDVEPGEQRLAVADLREERLEQLSNLVLEYKFWENPRKFTGLDEASMQALADDILEKSISTEEGYVAGNDEALKVVRIKEVDGAIVQLVIDGQRRMRAIEMGLARKTSPDEIFVKVVDRESDPVEWTEALAQKYLAEVLSAVGQRQGLSGYELSQSALRLRGTKDLETGKELTMAEIGKIIGRSPSWVSKILTALSNASPKLVLKWRKGELTEEQFRDLATAVTDKGEQDQKADKVTEARQGGDKGAARLAVKESAELAKQQRKNEAAEKKAEKERAAAEKKAEKDAQKAKSGKGKKGTAVRGPQAELPMQAQTAAKPEKPAEADKTSKPKALPFVVIEDMVGKAKSKPPTHDLVKGILLGVQIAAGLIAMDDLPKPWHTYVNHLAGAPAKPGKKARKK